MFHQAGHSQVVGDGDRIDHGQRRRRSVADDTDPVHPQQHGPPGALRIQLPGQRQQMWVKDIRCFFHIGSGQDLGEGSDEELHRALHRLQGDISGEAVGDDHVGHAMEEVPTFDVADELQARTTRTSAQKRVGVLLQGGSLRLLLTDRKQSHRRHLDAVALGDKRRPHLGELHQHLWTALGVGPGVEQNTGRPVGSRIGNGGGDRRADHPGQPPHPQEGGGHRGPGIAGGHHGHGLAVPHGFSRPHQRGVLLAANSLAGVVVHADDLGGM